MASKSKMKCNVVRSSDRAGKKKMVKACEGGKEKLIHFGAKGYGHNYSAAARKSFKARHKCGTATSKLTARYWSCKKLWAGKGGSTKSSPKSVAMKSKGLGDTIEKLTTATGVKRIVDKISKATGKDCGCGARKEKLNKAMPYK
jgi:hypothetical protein